MTFDTNLLINFLMLIATVLSVFVAIRAKIEARQIAEQSGSLEKPRLGLAVFNAPLGKGYPDNERWYFIHPGGAEDVAIYPIRFTVFNTGEVSSEGVVMRIQVPQSCFPAETLKAIQTIIQPSVLAGDFKSSVDEMGNFSLLSFALPPIRPKVPIEFEIPFAFRTSVGKNITVNAPLKDNTRVKLNVSLTFAYIVSIWLSPLDSEPIYFKMEVRTIPASNLEGGVNKYVEMSAQQSSSEQKRSLSEKLRDLLITVLEPQVSNLIAFEIGQQHTRKDKKIFFFMKLPENLYHSSFFITAIPKFDGNETGRIASIVEFKPVLRSSRKFRYKVGNVVKTR